MNEIPHYSTDISAAWKIIEKMEAEGWSVVLANMKDFSGNWQALFERSGVVVTSEGESAAHAICLASLKVVQRMVQ